MEDRFPLLIVMAGVLAVLFGRFTLGLDWVFSAALYFPSAGLASAILNNNGMKMLKNAIVLVACPLLVASVPNLANSLLSSVGPKVTSAGMDFARAIVTVVSFVVLYAVLSAALAFAGEFSVGSRIHAIAVKTLLCILCVGVLAAISMALRFANGRCFTIMPFAKMVLSLLMCLGLMFAFKRIFAMDVESLSRPQTSPLKSVEVAGKKKSPIRAVPRPDVRLADVVGMADAKEQIRMRLVEPVKNATVARRYGIRPGGGIMLYGPPGTGKTLLARAVAGELGLPFFVITAADVFGKYVGESEKNIRRLFREVRANTLSVVFIDELETLFPKRSMDIHETTRKVITMLLQELDGFDGKKNPMLLLGATNAPWMIDEAFLRPGRFDASIYVGLPDNAERRQMFATMLDVGDIPYEADIPAVMSAKTQGFSGADIKGVVEKIRQKAFLRRVRRYTVELATEALAESSPTSSAETVAKYESWGRRRT